MSSGPILRGLVIALGIAVATVPARAGDDPLYGDRDDAVGMVDRAVALYEAEGLEALIAAVSDPSDLRFHDRDMYPWVVGLDGVMIAHGANSSLNGKNVIAMVDSQGVEVFGEPIRLVRVQKSGWYDYTWWNPRSSSIEPKTAYVRGIGDDALVGVGVFVGQREP